MKYVDLTPRWTEILPTWKFILTNARGKDSPEFWDELTRMAQGADNFNDLVAALRQEGWADSAFEQTLKRGREINELARNTIKEDENA